MCDNENIQNQDDHEDEPDFDVEPPEFYDVDEEVNEDIDPSELLEEE